MQVHPGLRGGGLGVCDPNPLGWGVARGGDGRACHQAEIEQHRQPVAVAAQQVGGAEVAVHQRLAMQHGQHRQQLAQQQQHLAGTEDQLALGTGLQQQLVGTAGLPFAHQPQTLLGLNGRPEPGHLGMEQPLQLAPELARPGRVDSWAQQPQGHRRLGG